MDPGCLFGPRRQACPWRALLETGRLVIYEHDVVYDHDVVYERNRSTNGAGSSRLPGGLDG